VPDTNAGMDLECEEVLSICRAVFETAASLTMDALRLLDTLYPIARLAQKLQSGRWGCRSWALP